MLRCKKGGCVFMTYKKLLRIVARENSTTTEEVDKEIRAAIKSAGYDMSPELFIVLTTAKVKSKMNVYDQ